MAIRKNHMVQFGEKQRNFMLTLEAIENIENECDEGLILLYGKFATQSFRVKHLKIILTQGLIGGGMASVDAVEVVNLVLPQYPYFEALHLAQKIIEIALVGNPEIEGASVDAGERQAVAE